MRRRVISIGSVAIAVASLVVVLANATLVDRRGPTISSVTLSAPVEGQAGLALTLTAIDIQFSEPVRTTTVERRFRIEPYVAGTITWDGSMATFTPSDKLPADTEFRISIEPGFEDVAGNLATAGLEAFDFRTVGPPIVSAVDPAAGSDRVAVDTPVIVTFDRLMDTTSVEDAIEIEPRVSIQPSWSGRTVTLGFDAPLAFGTTYRLTVGRTAADTDGSRLRAAFTSEFTTVAAGLGIIETLPADGAAGISVRTPIAVVFDGPIDPESVEQALTITPSMGGDLRVVAMPNDDAAPRAGDEAPRTVLLFQPSNPLAAHTTYTVALDPIVARAGSPDQVATGRTWTFTTGQPTPSGHNHIAYISSRSGTVDAWLMNPDGSAPRQLTAGLAPVSAFDVTLDGTTVAFAAGGEVRTMAIDGSGEAVLTRDGRFEYAPRFSPDGRFLLVARRESDGTDAGWWLVPLQAGAGGERQVLPTGAPPLGSAVVDARPIEEGEGYPAWASRAAWDPSGRWLLPTTADGQVVLVDLAPDGASPAVLPTGLTATSAAAWDDSFGRFLVVGRLRDGQEGLWAIAVNGTISQVGEAAGSLAVSGDGAIALLVRSSSGVTHVGRDEEAGGTAPQQLTRGDALGDRWPTFSPDGRTILFGRVRTDDPTRSAGIWTVDASSGGPVALTTEGAYPRWLP